MSWIILISLFTRLTVKKELFNNNIFLITNDEPYSLVLISKLTNYVILLSCTHIKKAVYLLEIKPENNCFDMS